METRTFIASGAILPQRELTRMVDEVSDDVVGFGPIEFLLKDPEVTEVVVNGLEVSLIRVGASRPRITAAAPAPARVAAGSTSTTRSS